MRQQLQNERDWQQQQRCNGGLDCGGALLFVATAMVNATRAQMCVSNVSRPTHLLLPQLLCLHLPVKMSAVCAHDIAAACKHIMRIAPWAAATTAQVR
jgi:hypothetical protein